MVSLLIFAILNAFLYYRVRDSKTDRWRRIENNSDALAYLALVGSTVLGGISMIFVEPRVAEFMGY